MSESREVEEEKRNRSTVITRKHSPICFLRPPLPFPPLDLTTNDQCDTDIPRIITHHAIISSEDHYHLEVTHSNSGNTNKHFQ